MSTQAAYSIGELRHNAIHFLVGKVGSALLTFLVFVLLAHSLRLDGYGAYATLLAMVELGIALSTLGLDWATARYLPEYRLYASRKQFLRFLTLVSVPRVVALVLLAGLALGMQQFFAQWFSLGDYLFALKLYSGVLVFEGAARIIRDSILGELMQQRLAQRTLIIRNMLMLISIIWMKLFLWPHASADHIRLLDVAVAELLSALAGLVLLVYYLFRHLNRLPVTANAPAGWAPVDGKQIWRTAKHMYASYLLTLSYGAQVFTFIVNSWLGLQAAAVFGFMRNLTDFLRKYLPSEMFMTLIRPKFVAAFTASNGDVGALRRNALLAWKISLFVLAPGILFLAAYGREFVQLTSNGKFTDYSLLVFSMLLTLIPASQRRILEMVATIMHHPELCSRASAAGLVMLPLAFMLLSAGFGLWGIVFTLILGETLFNTVLIVSLKAHGYPYIVPLRSLLVFTGSCLSAWLLLRVVDFHPDAWWSLGLGFVSSTMLFLGIAYLLKPFTSDERGSVNHLIKKPLFVW
ncbi:MAG: hypothetical protein ABS92_01105 [Thiobacillus sp. SCN 63-374]|nr:MAG: hypothetical protein ABS92_01105 [Thiobacillus sp. SCN 63-374]